MANVKIVVHGRAVSALLRSPQMLQLLEGSARRIADAAGAGHEVDSDIGARRARASVRTATAEARHAEATSRALTRSIDAGRA